MTLWETNSRLNRFMPIFGYLSWLSTSLRITNNWFNNWFPFRACPSTSFRLGEVARFGADVVTPTSPHWSPVECLQIQTSKEVSHLNVTVGWAEGKTKTIPLKKKVSSKTHYISNYIYNLRDFKYRVWQLATILLSRLWHWMDHLECGLTWKLVCQSVFYLSLKFS